MKSARGRVDRADPEQSGERPVVGRCGHGEAVEPRRAGDVDAVGRLAELTQPGGGVLRGDAVLVGELGDGVPHPLVERSLGHLSPVQVHDGHAEEHRGGHDVEQLPAVTEHDEHVDALLAQGAARTRAIAAPCSSWASR